MIAYRVSDYPRSQHIASVQAAGILVAFVSGTLALVALFLGSPLEFGSALAVCSTAWIVANFAERLAEQKRTDHRLTFRSGTARLRRRDVLITFARILRCGDFDCIWKVCDGLTSNRC